jgi:thiamine biosynthesis protein ThiI
LGCATLNLERAVTFDTPVLAVHYAEIALKGRNRHAFLRRLRNNILVALKGEPVSHVNHIESRLLVRLDDATRADAVAAKLQRVFGVQWLSVATAVPRASLGDDLAGLGEVAAALARRDVGNARTFRVDTRRSDRTFPLISTEINRLVGNAVGEAIQLPVRLHGADFTVHVLMLRNEALIFTQRLPGPGGLPASSGGRVMTLLSGGIDSPVAAWMLMRRGCRSDFIHFYTGRTAAEADAAKILRLAAILREHTPTDLHLYLAPTYPYESRAIGVIAESHDMVLFRRYMLKVAEQLARRTDCHALVTGDSLGQVASQTLYNLGAIGPDVRLPVFRPLIGTDKVEISALARRIGTFETSIEPYRDCCSLRSPHPILRGRAREVLALSERMDMAGAILEALEAVEKIVITEPGA